jgi:putative ABC transport system substrate-binding protein
MMHKICFWERNILAIALRIVFLSIFFSFSSSASAEKSPVFGLVYPQLREPFSSVFTAIIAGMERQLGRHALQKFVLPEEDRMDDLAGQIILAKVDVLLILGRQGLTVTDRLPESTKLLLGAVLTPSSGEFKSKFNGGIALAPAPEQLFGWLHRLAPRVKQVYVVYNPDLNQWLIDYAQVAASERGLKLHALPAGDLREAASLYRRLVGQLGPEHGLWLPQDSYTVDQQTTLPMLLEEAWDREFVLFSSNPAHVQRGVLFGLYPDNVAMGERLGRMALAFSEGKPVKNSPIEPLSDLLIAVNVRTADHLRLNMSKGLIETFNLTFPASR